MVGQLLALEMIMNTFPAVEYAPRCFLGAMSVSSSGALGRFRHTRVNRERIKWVELRAILCQNSHGQRLLNERSRFETSH
jgi:hypothetical protein